LPRDRHVSESGLPDSDPSNVFANPATQSQFGILHCPPLTSRNSTMQSLTSKVGDGSESCLAQSNLSRFSSLMTRTDNGSGRARTGTATPADLRPPKDRGPFLFVFPASRRTDPRVHCPHLKSRNSTMCPLKNKVYGGSEPVLAQRNPSRFSLSTTRADNGSARPRTGTEIPADLRQPKDRGPFFVCPSSAPTTGSAPTAPTCNQGMVRCTLYELWCAMALHRSCPENPLAPFLANRGKTSYGGSLP